MWNTLCEHCLHMLQGRRTNGFIRVSDICDSFLCSEKCLVEGRGSCCAFRLEWKALQVCRFLAHLLRKASIIPSAIPRCCFPSFLSLNSSWCDLPTSSREITADIIWYLPTSHPSMSFKSGFCLAQWWSNICKNYFTTPCPEGKSLYTFYFSMWWICILGYTVCICSSQSSPCSFQIPCYKLYSAYPSSYFSTVYKRLRSKPWVNREDSIALGTFRAGRG